MSIRFKNSIKESLQVVFSKNDKEKLRFTTRREVREETGLKLSQMQYLVTNKDYNCDIYIYDIKRFKSRHMEFLKINL